jgi:hypothetical protein
MLDHPTLSKSDARFNSATELGGAFLAKTRLPLPKRIALAAAVRDGLAAVVKPTVAQCAQLCRVPPAVLRDRRRSSRKPSLATVWARATADEQTAFLRAQLDALLAK